MRDPDDIQAYEAKQQRLVDEIVDSFYRANDDDHAKMMETAAVTLLQSLTHKRIMSTDQVVKRLYDDARDRIIAFLNAEIGSPSKPDTNSELWLAERQYLLLKVFERVMASVSSGIIGTYQSQEIHREYKKA